MIASLDNFQHNRRVFSKNFQQMVFLFGYHKENNEESCGANFFGDKRTNDP